MEELEKNTSDEEEESLFPEHDFLFSCLKINLHIEDLKVLTYVDVIKMLIPILNKSSKKECKKATQNDINIFLKGG